MAAWDDEDSDGGSPPPVVKKSKFDDEEEQEDVADAWDAEDSEEEREKAQKKAAADAKKAAEAAANKKPKTQRIAERSAEHAAEKERLQARLAELEDEDGQDAKERARQAEIEADLANAGDLLGAVAIGSQTSRKTAADRSLIQHKTESGEQFTFDLATLPLFQPKLKSDFDEVKNKLVPLFANMQKKGNYPLFLQEFFRDTAKGMSSEQIKKLASILTTLSNEKLREEKAADTKGKSKGKGKAKAQVTLGAATAGKSHTPDTTNYDNEIDDYDDFM